MKPDRDAVIQAGKECELSLGLFKRFVAKILPLAEFIPPLVFVAASDSQVNFEYLGARYRFRLRGNPGAARGHTVRVVSFRASVMLHHW
jgi:hypothetical protein